MCAFSVAFKQTTAKSNELSRTMIPFNSVTVWPPPASTSNFSPFKVFTVSFMFVASAAKTARHKQIDRMDEE